MRYIINLDISKMFIRRRYSFGVNIKKIVLKRSYAIYNIIIYIIFNKFILS